MNSETLQLVFTAVTALAVLLQAIILLAIYLGVSKAMGKVKEEVEEFRSSVMPIITNSRDLIARVMPKIEAATSDIQEMTHGLRVQSAEIEASTTEILDRLRRQAGRLDVMLTGALDTVDRTSTFVADAVSRPVRQLSGMLASAKAIVETLRAPVPPRSPAPEHREQDSPADKNAVV